MMQTTYADLQSQPRRESALEKMMEPRHTSVKPSSIDAYHAHKAGDLSNQQAQILAAVPSGATVTRRWLASKTGLETSCVAGRVNELVADGKLEVLPDRVSCPITGRRVEGLRLVEAA